ILQNRQLLPHINNPRALPYSDSIGQQSFFIRNLPPHLAPMPKLSAKSIVDCLICGKNCSLNKMREHVGGHILLSLRGVEEPGPVIRKVGVNPCGFCGLDGCVTQLTISKRRQAFNPIKLPIPLRENAIQGGKSVLQSFAVHKCSTSLHVMHEIRCRQSPDILEI
ncbi:hypothetical protein B0H10DRAFT_2327815, partial [Mycena sp. CBHHK59/15]